MTTSAAVATDGAGPVASGREQRGRALLGRPVWPWVLLLAVTTALARVPFVGVALSPDEAGYLTVAGQWRPGGSLYGDLWVDRPPGLLLLHGLADALGGQVALRVLGMAAAATSVVAAALLAWWVTGHRSSVLAAAVLVAATTSSMFLQVNEVNGEILGLPFLLLGLAALALGWRRATADGVGRPPPRRLVAAGVAAGVCAALAASVKQSLLDVVVAGLLLVVVLAARGRVRQALLLLGGAVVGAAAVTVLLLGVAWLRGTSPVDLWDALVTFRVQAGELVRTTATPAVVQRAWSLLGAWLVTGLPLLLLLALLLPWRRAPDRAPRPSGVRPVEDPAWSWAVAAVLAFEVVTVVLGGSYWWHYLVVLVPGTTLLLALAWPHRRTARARTRARWLLAAVVLSGVGSHAWLLVHPTERDEAERELVAWLLEQGSAGATGATAYGGPHLLRDAGLVPTYEHLWSLPARVRDSDLREMRRLLASADRPDWVIVAGRGFATWGVGPEAAARTGEVAREHYRVVHRNDRFTVLRVLR